MNAEARDAADKAIALGHGDTRADAGEVEVRALRADLAHALRG